MGLMISIIGCALCIIIGAIIGHKISNMNRPKPAGILQIYIDDGSDEPPYLFLDLDESVTNICNSKSVIFDVSINHVSSRD